jgi:hypothetical protein
VSGIPSVVSEEVDGKTGDVDFIDVGGLAFTPREHERLKSILHGERFRELAFSDRRYLVLGAGGDTEAADRRMLVYELLGGRPDATAFRLEDFKLIRMNLRYGQLRTKTSAAERHRSSWSLRITREDTYGNSAISSMRRFGRRYLELDEDDSRQIIERAIDLGITISPR